jgi:hypothetical protein
MLTSLHWVTSHDWHLREPSIPNKADRGKRYVGTTLLVPVLVTP